MNQTQYPSTVTFYRYLYGSYMKFERVIICIYVDISIYADKRSEKNNWWSYWGIKFPSQVSTFSFTPFLQFQANYCFFLKSLNWHETPSNFCSFGFPFPHIETKGHFDCQKRHLKLLPRTLNKMPFKGQHLDHGGRAHVSSLYTYEVVFENKFDKRTMGFKIILSSR